MNISEQSLKGIVFIINGCQLLTSFQRVFKEPVKVFHLQILANQLRAALVVEIINNSFCKSSNKFGCVIKQEILLKETGYGQPKISNI